MILDDIRHHLATAREVPKAALAAAIEQAEALMPEVLRLIDLACDRIPLTRPEERLLFYGVHVLAAARRTELYEPLLRLTERRSGDFRWLLCDALLDALLISSFGPGSERPYDLLTNPDVDGESKVDLFRLIAWMVWRGHAPHDEFIVFLDRFDQVAADAPESIAWHGWEDAIRLLRLTEFEDRVRAGWRAGRSPYDRDVDRAEWARELHRPADSSADEELFKRDDLAPIDDVPKTLRSILFLGFGHREVEDEYDGKDPAHDVRLLSDERGWLDWYLEDESTPPSAMTLECVDGFLTALAAGPQEIPIEEWWPVIWGVVGTDKPVFQTASLEPYLRELLTRHLATIQRRLKAGCGLMPWVDEDSPPAYTEEWAVGFSIGMDLRPKTWHPITEHEQASLAVAPIGLLLPEDALEAEGRLLSPPDDDARRNIIITLPDLIAMIYRFWRGQPVLPQFEPRRVQKIGRNEPCPCGSGRKYKKCCGANAPSALN